LSGLLSLEFLSQILDAGEEFGFFYAFKLHFILIAGALLQRVLAFGNYFTGC
tara:strand:- start:98 stop:253 length:156 start_codon:yes stop_codon:yes gene_type:complete